MRHTLFGLSLATFPIVMIQAFLSFFIFILFAATAMAQQSPIKKCQPFTDESQICQFQIIARDMPRVYKYEIRPAKPGFPTVVMIPGGPGQSLIGLMKTLPAPYGISKDFGVVLIDPRGTGRNYLGRDSKGEIYSSELVAADIFKVLQVENFENYYLWGGSYGTVVATHLGALVSSSNLNKPRAVILSGVFGHHLRSVVDGMNDQLNRLFSYYSDEQRARILEGLKKIRQEFGANEYIFSWNFISLFSANNEDPDSEIKNQVNMKSFFDALSKGQEGLNHNVAKKLLGVSKAVPTSKWLTYLTTSYFPRVNTMGEVIRCREMMTQNNLPDIRFDFEEKKFVASRYDCVDKGYVIDRPFDSARLQIKNIPIVYIQGLLDTATPIKGAIYHYKNQTHAEKIFIQLNYHSHNVAAGLKPCFGTFWSALQEGISKLRDQMGLCLKGKAVVY